MKGNASEGLTETRLGAGIDSSAEGGPSEVEAKGSSQEEARRFHRIGRRVGFTRIGLGVLYLGILLVSGLSIALAGWSRSVVANPWGALAVHFSVLMAGHEILNFPLDILGGYRPAQRFGVSHQPFFSWLIDRLKAASIGLILGLLGFEILYWLMRVSNPAVFPLWAGLGFLLFLLLASWLAPVVLLPVFFKTQPVVDDALKRRLAELARRSGTKIGGIFQFDLGRKSRTANAALTGLGKTRRILLSDTLLEGFTHEEISVVLAHELAHHKRRHIPKLIAAQAVLGVGLFYLASFLLSKLSPLMGIAHPADPAGLPLFLITLGGAGLLIAPFGNWVSRRMERGCDGYALELTQDPVSFLSAMRKLSRLNLAEESPSRWVEILYHSHPPISRRLDHGEEFRRECLAHRVEQAQSGGNCPEG